jgi:hypothetical protein
MSNKGTAISIQSLLTPIDYSQRALTAFKTLNFTQLLVTFLQQILLQLIHPEKIRNISLSSSPHMGPYILIEIGLNASEAFEIWNFLVDRLYPRTRIPVFVTWKGEMDLSPSDFGKKLGEILAKMNTSLFTLTHPVDLTKEFTEE